MQGLDRSSEPAGSPPPANVAVVGRLASASAMLKPLRLEILGLLAAPISATGLSRRLGQPRQRLNYHLRELEKAGLIRCVAERRKGNCVERLYQTTARHYVIGPEALGRVSPPAQTAAERARGDRFSWSYLVTQLTRALVSLATLRRRADDAGQRLATAGLETSVRFASPAGFAEFNERLAAAVSGLVAEFHQPEGRSYEVFLGCYPTLKKGEEEQ